MYWFAGNEAEIRSGFQLFVVWFFLRFSFFVYVFPISVILALFHTSPVYIPSSSIFSPFIHSFFSVPRTNITSMPKAHKIFQTNNHRSVLSYFSSQLLFSASATSTDLIHDQFSFILFLISSFSLFGPYRCFRYFQTSILFTLMYGRNLIAQSKSKLQREIHCFLSICLSWSERHGCLLKEWIKTNLRSLLLTVM